MSRDIVYWDNRLSWASTIFFIASAVNATLKNIFYFSSTINMLLSAFFGLIIIGSYLSCWKELQKRAGRLFWATVGLFVFIYSFSALLIIIQGDPLDLMLKGTAFLTFAWWIPTGVIACSVIDKSVLYNTWVKASYLISFFCILLFVFHKPIDDPESAGAIQYNMFFGYTIILPLLIQITEFLRTKKLIIFLLVVFEVFSVFLFASRGVLLSLFFFVIYKFAFESNNITKKVFATLFLVLVIYVMTMSIQNIAERLVDFLSLFDIQSRTLDALALGLIDDTSGRDAIWKLCFKMIEERPIFGWGLGGEYYHISQTLTGTVEGLTAEAWHPHNGLIQNFVCFGILGGFVANIICIYPLFHLKKTNSIDVHNLLVIFASASVIPICVSSANFFTTPAVAIYLFLFYFRRPLHLKSQK